MPLNSTTEPTDHYDTGTLPSSTRCDDSTNFFDSLTFTISLYRPSLFVSPLDDIQCPLKSDEYKFLLLGQHWCVNMSEAIWEYLL